MATQRQVTATERSLALARHKDGQGRRLCWFLETPEGRGDSLGHGAAKMDFHPSPAVQDSCDTLGASYTTDWEDDAGARSEGNGGSLGVGVGAMARPRSPQTPQAQIVKNNFKMSYRRPPVPTSGGKQQQAAALSYRSEFISPEILRDGKHGTRHHHHPKPLTLPLLDSNPAFLRRRKRRRAQGSSETDITTPPTTFCRLFRIARPAGLFTHFEERLQRAVPAPPSSSPKEGACFVRTRESGGGMSAAPLASASPQRPSPAMRVRKLRLFKSKPSVTSFEDKSARAYYETPPAKQRVGLGSGRQELLRDDFVGAPPARSRAGRDQPCAVATAVAAAASATMAPTPPSRSRSKSAASASLRHLRLSPSPLRRRFSSGLSSGNAGITGRREVRGKLSFPAATSAVEEPQRQGQNVLRTPVQSDPATQQPEQGERFIVSTASTVSTASAAAAVVAAAAAAIDERGEAGADGGRGEEENELVGAGAAAQTELSPTSVMDMAAAGGSALAHPSLCCDLCGQQVNQQALLRICKAALPALQSRGRFLAAPGSAASVMNLDGENPAAVAAAAADLGAWQQTPASVSGTERLEVSDEEWEVGGPPAALLCNAPHKSRRRSQKKLWRSIEWTRDASEAPQRERAAKFKDMVRQDLARKYSQEHHTSAFAASARAHTPVKNLIYTSAKQPACKADLNAATLLFASQLKLTLGG